MFAQLVMKFKMTNPSEPEYLQNWAAAQITIDNDSPGFRVEVFNDCGKHVQNERCTDDLLADTLRGLMIDGFTLVSE